jgi:hypothetical protein
MKTRGEVEEQAERHDTYLQHLDLILEMLVDIRDLLVKVEDNTRGHI